MRRVLAWIPALLACDSSTDRVPFTAASPVAMDAGGDASLMSPGRDAGSSCTEASCSKLKLAFTRFYLGDTDRGGHALSYAWEYYGADLDGLHSNYTLNGECLPPEGEPQYAPLDGLNGYDNEWGRRIVPLLEPWDPTPSKASTDAIAASVRRPIIMLGQLGGGLGGATLHASFTYLLNGQTEPELASYEAATFENGTFDSGPSRSPVTIELTLGPQVMRVSVQRLRVHFDLGADGRAIGGQLSGAIRVIDLQAAVIDHVGRSAPAECGGAKLGDFKTAIANTADVLSDGRLDRSAHCDAISFGVGFEAEPVVVTGTTSYPPTLTPPCP